MDYNRHWDLSLSNGVNSESYLAKVLSITGDKIEVKLDLQAYDTGNLFIEVQSRGKTSGLAITKAEWFAYIIVEVQDKQYNSYVFNENDVVGVILMNTDRLRDRVKYLPKIAGGDKDSSVGALLPLSNLPMTDSPVPRRVRN